jgi:isoleucyl-tRNA synthetase
MVMAPTMPFFAEFIYQNDKTEKSEESVHLCNWPKSNKKKINKDLEEKMDEVRNVVSLALSERLEKGIKVKQPLSVLKIKNEKLKIKEQQDLLDLIIDEVNVKNIKFDKTIEKEVELDVNITEELKEEGDLRDIIRQVQGERKNQGLKPENEISVVFKGTDYYVGLIEKNKKTLLKELRAKDILTQKEETVEKGLILTIKKI